MSPRTVGRPSRAVSAARAVAVVAFGGLLDPARVPAVALAAEAREVRSSPPDLAELTLEELMSIEVTSVSKKAEKLWKAAAAVHVITGEDIQRSGVTTIAEALRLAPALQVARIDAHTWAISARGFLSQFSNKLLVLIDGRTVYTPAFSGVYWDAQDVNLEDVERIEIIRGPGATVWGANAVNGVVNIITKPARDTQGFAATTGGGAEEIAFGTLRSGGKLDERTFYRAYGKFSQRDDSVSPTGDWTPDGWWSGQGGFRVDWKDAERNAVTLQGDLYRADLEQVITLATLDPPFTETSRFDRDVRGANLLARWEHTFEPDSDLELQLYYDRVERRQLFDEETVETLDLEGRQRFPLPGRQEIVWGLGYRLVHDWFANTFALALDPNRRRSGVANAFVQDEISVFENRLGLILGSKFERNDYTGFEIEPSARLAWTPGARHMLWAAVSGAVRTPSRWEDDVRINVQVAPGPTVVSVFGKRDVVSEELTAYELGYRAQPQERTALDVAAFYNVYDRLRSFEPGAIFFESSPPPDHAVVPLYVDNKLAAETYGVELTGRWRPTNRWRLLAGYTFLNLALRRVDGGQDPSFEREEGSSPEQQALLRSAMDLPGDLELDCGVRYVDFLPALAIPSYVATDVRLGWRPHDRFDVSITGQNLFDRRHPEFRPAFLNTQVTEVEPSVWGKIAWRL